MNFILDCKTWRCGREFGGNQQLGKGLTRLLNPQGFSCCVGQFLIQLGFTEDEIINKAVAGSVKERKDKNIFILTKEKEIGEEDDTIMSSTLYGVNDGSLSVKEKINKIREHLKQYGHSLEVINEDILATLPD